MLSPVADAMVLHEEGLNRRSFVRRLKAELKSLKATDQNSLDDTSKLFLANTISSKTTEILSWYEEAEAKVNFCLYLLIINLDIFFFFRVG